MHSDECTKPIILLFVSLRLQRIHPRILLQVNGLTLWSNRGFVEGESENKQFRRDNGIIHQNRHLRHSLQLKKSYHADHQNSEDTEGQPEEEV